MQFGSSRLYAAALADIIKSKRAAGRPRDRAVLEVREETLEESAAHQESETGSSPEGK